MENEHPGSVPQHGRASGIRPRASGFALVALLLPVSPGFPPPASAAVRYVDAGSTNATAPYTNWTTAAQVIQDAVDAAEAGDEIVVTNGTYATGGRAAGTNALRNRVAVDKPLTLRSVNGPDATAIRGFKVPGGFLGCGDGAIRCVALASGATFSGFTLTSGATRIEGDSRLEQSGGGVWCESSTAVVSNCVLTGNGAWYGGGAYGGTFNNCVLTNNSARTNGGASFESTLKHCILAHNSARFAEGGGAYGCTLNDCILTGNLAYLDGGGASESTLSDCTLTGNMATWLGGAGGGVFHSTLNRSTLTNNSASSGGGAYWCMMTNCILTGNSASGSGGGAHWSTLANCTLTGNRANGTDFWSGGGGAAQSTLFNCVLSNNRAAWYGGGVSSDPNLGFSVVRNCLLAGNSARNGGGSSESALTDCVVSGNWASDSGGGVSGGSLKNGLLNGNSATNSGGGATHAGLYNCTVTGNAAGSGGGAFGGWLRNCVIYFNAASTNGANHDGATLLHCCTTPMPENGDGNTTDAPQFVDLAGGNLRLQSNSPCINAGSNSFVTGTTDRDGRPRIVGGTVDIGAYEFQAPGMGEFIAWLQRYGLPTDGSADPADPDGDGHSAWQEWRCRTDPTNALSALRLLSASSDGTNATVTWQSVAGLSYFLERSTNLSFAPTFSLAATNLVGQTNTTSFTDTNAANLAPLFYRVGVGN